MAVLNQGQPILAFNVLGLPAPQGSKRHMGNGVMREVSPLVGTWREDVKHAALNALLEQDRRRAPGEVAWDASATQVRAHIVFSFPRPRSHFRTGRQDHLLRADAPVLHSVRPDLDKLLRSTLDALTTAGVIHDDCRVSWLIAAKAYVLVPGQPQSSSVAGAMPQPGAHIILMPLVFGGEV